jgi:hypothetical protein
MARPSKPSTANGHFVPTFDKSGALYGCPGEPNAGERDPAVFRFCFEKLPALGGEGKKA